MVNTRKMPATIPRGKSIARMIAVNEHGSEHVKRLLNNAPLTSDRLSCHFLVDPGSSDQGATIEQI